MWRCCAARVTHYLPIYQFHCPDITSTAVSDHACTQNKVALFEVTGIPDPNRQKQSNTESGKFQAGAHKSIMYVAYCIQSQRCLQCVLAFSQLYVVLTDVVNKSADIEHKSAEVPAQWSEFKSTQRLCRSVGAMPQQHHMSSCTGYDSDEDLQSMPLLPADPAATPYGVDRHLEASGSFNRPNVRKAHMTADGAAWHRFL